MVNNTQILNEIVNPQEKMVFKGMKEDMLTGKALLNPEQLGRFLRATQLNNTILTDASFEVMKSDVKELTRAGLVGRVLQDGYKADGKTTEDQLTVPDVEFKYNELKAVKLKAKTEITDEEKEDNIEQAAFENTLLDMMGERIGEDMEIWAVYADKAVPRATDSLLSTTDGWFKRATDNSMVVESTGATGTDFDIENNDITAMFDSLLGQIGRRFRDKSKLKFYVPYEVEDAYRNYLGARQTALGDTNIVNTPVLNYKSIPIVHCNTFDDEIIRDRTDKVNACLTIPNNLVQGMWKNMTIEPKRIPEEELTEYYYRLRGDVDMYQNEATAFATMTVDEAEAIQDINK